MIKEEAAVLDVSVESVNESVRTRSSVCEGKEGDALCDLRRGDEERVSPYTHRVEIRLAQYIDPVCEKAL
jgi:hypothetical protein